MSNQLREEEDQALRFPVSFHQESDYFTDAFTKKNSSVVNIAVSIFSSPKSKAWRSFSNIRGQKRKRCTQVGEQFSVKYHLIFLVSKFWILSFDGHMNMVLICTYECFVELVQYKLEINSLPQTTYAQIMLESKRQLKPYRMRTISLGCAYTGTIASLVSCEKIPPETQT